MCAAGTRTAAFCFEAHVVLAAGGMDLGTATGRVVIDVSGVGAAMAQAQSVFQGGLGQMSGLMQNFGNRMAGVGVAISGIAAPLALAGKKGIEAAADFDVLLNQIKVFGGVAPAELDKVREYALKMGADTKFSASDAAASMLDLLKSGQSLEQAMASLPAVMNLAAAGEMSLAQAAGITSSALAQFGLKAEDAGRVADALARAANASRADVSDLGMALGNVGPIAAQFGLSIEDTAAMLGVMSNAGIEGAEAGTQLKSMLLNLSRPTESVKGAFEQLGVSLYDSAGNTRNFNQVIKDLDAALDQLPLEQQNELMQTLAGSYGIVGFTALRASGGIDSMLQSMSAAPDAAAVAEEFMNSFKGVTESFAGSLETLMIEFFTPYMNEVLTPMIKRKTEIVNAVTAWAKANPELTKTIAGIIGKLTILGPSLIIIGKVAAALPGIVSAIGTGLTVLTGPVGLVLAGVVALGWAFETNFLGIRDVVERVTAALGYLFDFMGRMTSFSHLFMVFEDGSSVLGEFLERLLQLDEATANERAAQFLQGFQPVIQPITQAVEALSRFFSALQAGIPIGKAFHSLLGDLEPVAQGLITSIQNALAQFNPAAIWEDLRTRLTNAVTNLNWGDVAGAVEAQLVRSLSQLQFKNLPAGIATIGNRIKTALLEWIKLHPLTEVGIDLQNIAFNITNFDFGSALQTFRNQLQIFFSGETQQLDLTGAQQALTDNLDKVIELAITGIGILAGGPVGAGIGLGKLLASAIENDFLGIGTFLEESGIQQSIEDIFNDIVGLFTTTADTTFGEASVQPPPGIVAFGLTWEQIIGAVNKTLQSIGGDLWQTIQNLFNGLKGFVQEVAKADFSGLDDILLAIGGLIGKLVQVAISGVEGLSEGFERLLPDLGQVIADLISLISNIVTGDWDQAGETFKNLVGAIVKALLDVPAGLADGFLGALEGLLGINLPSVSEGLAALGRGLSDAWLAIQLVFDNVKRDFARFFLDIKIEIERYILGFREMILQATGGKIDIAPDIQIDVQKDVFERQGLDLADQLYGAMLTAISNKEPIDLSGDIEWALSPEGIAQVEQWGLDIFDLVADSLSFDAQRRLPEVIAQAFAAGDTATLDVLLPVAAKLDLSQEQLMLQIAEQVYQAGGEAQARGFLTDVAVPTLAQLDIPPESLMAQFDAFITGAAAAKTYEAKPLTLATLVTDLPHITTQIGNFVTAAASAITFHAQARSDVTVNAGAVNTSPFISTVTSFIQQALTGLQNLVSNPAGIASLIGAGANLIGNLIPGHENGLPYVPYDGYIARLHAGEGVLTAAENRARFSASGSGTTEDHRIIIQALTIHATSEAEGRAAAFGFNEELTKLRRGRG